MKFKRQTIGVLDYLQKQHYITYSRQAYGHLIKFKITDWEKFNVVLDYNAPCQKDTGFFFFPVSKANELIRMDVFQTGARKFETGVFNQAVQAVAHGICRPLP
jgi:hypothetical protein